ncbi:hypothetical protein HNQ60_002661 [Povalibacter uvarum]|uniref:Alpha/beta hydrolase n=1 Tax=Povalibacter uvarum TaxID=732238 RepID=A0A841HND0_9GAMM|nr:hypothetical protein [Povalibacter uvarum]MBB6093780.1 hypothetical protein [Povalibacter uvarum]
MSKSFHWRRWCAFVAAIVAVTSPSVAATRIEGDLPRKVQRAPDEFPGIDTVYGELAAGSGVRLRTIMTRPQGATGRLPAILFVQWLSCSTIELPPAAQDGWSQMLRRVITDSGAMVLRVEKAGVGDSVGLDCSALDYETELAHHRAAFAKLRSMPGVDPDRIAIYGASMGATYAPLIAQGQSVRGIAVWGGGARTWYERMLAFDRRAMELSGRKPDEIRAAMMQHVRFHLDYLDRGMTPAAIAQRDPSLADVWSQIVGAKGDLHYGRPLAFHQQAQRRNWAGAWGEVDAPVLALIGEYDWFEEQRSAEAIALMVNRRKAGAAQFRVIPKMDHHFAIYADPEAAFAERDGRNDPGPALEVLMPWLQRILQ